MMSPRDARPEDAGRTHESDCSASANHREHGDPLHAFEGLDPLSLEVFRAMKRTMRLNRQLLSRSALAEGGHPAQAGCLWALAHQDGITQRQLAEQLHIAPATVTAMVQRLEREGAVERWTDADDQRLTRIRLTEAGREQARRHGATIAESLNSVVGRLSKKDQRELVRILDLLSDSIVKEIDR